MSEQLDLLAGVSSGFADLKLTTPLEVGRKCITPVVR